MESDAALVVELLGCIEIQSAARNGAAESVLGDVLQIAVQPGISDCEKDRAIPANEDVFINLCGRGVDIGASTRANRSSAFNRLSNLGILRGGFFLGVFRWGRGRDRLFEVKRPTP